MSSIHQTGQGELYWGDKRVATVAYSLTHTPPTLQGMGDPPQGTMGVIEGERDLMPYNGSLVLHLEKDDLLLDVLITSQPVMPLPQFGGTYEIKGAGEYHQQ